MMQTPATLCNDAQLTTLVQSLERDERTAMVELEALVQRHPGDPRLHFLHGSLLAGNQRYPDAIAAVARAVELAPDYRIARFQLGFLYYTSGDAASAISVWHDLRPSDPDDELACFAAGLERLAVDDFAPGIALLRQGQAINAEHPLLSGDMQKIIDEIEKLPKADDASATTDSAHVLLQHYSAGTFTKH